MVLNVNYHINNNMSKQLHEIAESPEAIKQGRSEPLPQTVENSMSFIRGLIQGDAVSSTPKKIRRNAGY